MKNYIKDFNQFAINEEDMGMRGRDVLDSEADQLCMNIRRSSSPDLIMSLLNSGANPNAYDSQGRTPLQCAIEASNAAAVEVLLDMGADPNLRFSVGRSGMRPLEYAEYIMGGSYRNTTGMDQIIDMLIKAGAE